jgi:phosphoglycolate phosphatase-like HAD superfamily hydrolase
MTKTQKRLLLFDIDGTLIHSGGAGIHALMVAFKERFGIDDDLHDIEIAGMTDSGIVLSILNKHKIPATTENVSAFLDSYIHFLSLELPRRKGNLLPGVLELLERLKSRQHVVLALLTGNVSRGARLKLEHYGVWHFFEFGAFADDHRDRNELGRFARARAKEKHGGSSPRPKSTSLATPRATSRAAKCSARGRSQSQPGRWGRDELAKHHPDFLIDDLSNVETIMDTLGW